MRVGLIAVLLASVELTPAAFADTFQFSFTGANVSDPFYDQLRGGPTLSFSFQVSGLPVLIDMGDGTNPVYKFPSVQVSSSNNAVAGNVYLALDTYDPAYHAGNLTFESGPWDCCGISGFTTLKNSFYVGDPANPTFLPGVYDTEYEFRAYTLYDGPLTVTDVTTATPEPSSLVLLGTGLLGLAGALRRRRSA